MSSFPRRKFHSMQYWVDQVPGHKMYIFETPRGDSITWKRGEPEIPAELKLVLKAVI